MIKLKVMDNIYIAFVPVLLFLKKIYIEYKLFTQNENYKNGCMTVVYDLWFRLHYVSIIRDILINILIIISRN